MQIPKLQVLIEAGVVRAVEVAYAPDPAGWTVQVTYASRAGERCEVLDRQRGGVRVFATLDAVARVWPGWACRRSGWTPAGLAGAGDEPP